MKSSGNKTAAESKKPAINLEKSGKSGRLSRLLKRLPVPLKILIYIIIFFAAIKIFLFLLPSKQLTAFLNRQNSTKFYDRNGILLQVLPLENGIRREFIPLEKVPKKITEAFIQAEDKSFYYHPGVDLFSIFRAFIQNSKNQKIVSGASTITMQLARIIYPRQKNSPVNLSTKFTEMLQAFYLEAKFPKKKILELYLNNVPFSFQTEGISSAARTFFNTDLDSLSHEQIEILSQIPRRPSNYAPKKKYVYPQLCPHFVNYVISQYKKQHKKIPDELYLSIDSNLCEMAASSIQQLLTDYQDARIHNGAAFVINNRTGEIFCYIGNGNFYDEQHSGQIDGILVKNQPGSSMKPFLYAMALENGFEPSTILPDIQQDFGGEKVYAPLNFNNRFNGPVKMRISLASSLNIPAVYLLYHLGVSNYMSLLSELGFTSLEGQRNSTGLSLALGSSEVTLFEMVHAFSVFPNDGYLNRINYLKQNSAKSDEYKNPENLVYSADTSRIICDFLSDKSARELGFGHAKVFDTPYPCIFKTGTSNQFQNIIALGATSEFTAGVWMGNFEGETVIRQTGSTIPATIVRELLDELTTQYSAQEFLQPVNYAKKEICTLSGKAPGKYCPSVSKEFLRIDTKTKSVPEPEICNWHSIHNGHVEINYPSEYQHWATGKNLKGTSKIDGTALNLVYPKNAASFVFDSTIPYENQMLQIQASGGSVDTAELFIDGIFFGKTNKRFFWNVPLTTGSHTIVIKCGTETISSAYTVN